MSSTENVEQLLGWYLDEIGRHPLLTPQQERQLAQRVQRGDPEARQQLIRSNLRLVVDIAKGFARDSLELLECIGAGNEGLIRAVEKYEPERGVRFASYAGYWIKQRIRRRDKENDSQITTPRDTVAAARTIRKLRSHHRRTGQPPPSLEEIAEQTRFSLSVLRRGEDALIQESSLEAPVAPGSSLLFKEVLGAEDDILDRVEQKELRRFVRRGLATLSEEERLTLVYRYGLDTGVERSKTEIASLLDCSVEWARRLLKRAETKFTDWARRQPLVEEWREG